jgi:TonB family protein
MSDYLHTFMALGWQLDILSLTGISVAALFLFAICRQYYVHFTTPPACPVQPWYPIPEDLPTGPVAPYGATAIKASYQPNMTLGVNGSAALHLTFILAALLTARVLEKPVLPTSPPDRPLPRPDWIPPPPPLDPQSPAAQKYEPGLAPPPMDRIPIPVPDSRANPHATIAPITEADLGPTNLDPSQYSIFGKGGGGREDGPGKGPYGFGVEEEKIYSIEIVERLPELVTIPQPEYPEEARLAQAEGMVLLNVLVGKDGRVKDVKIAKSIPILDESARAAAVRAVFRPALWQNKPVSVWVSLPIRFSLRRP